MKFIIALALIAVVSCAPIHEDMKPIVEYINSIETTWTAGLNPRHDSFTMESLKAQCGALKENVHEKLPELQIEIPTTVPDSFDSRTQWPKCESIQEVRDQSSCGSCWAFGAVEAMSDRLCIASGQSDQTRISAEDLLSCCSSCGSGCEGGYPSAAWDYYQSTGLVSGDLYGTKTGCQAYSMAPCAHHTTSTKYPACPSDMYPTPSCTKKCDSGSSQTWSSDNHKGSSSFSVSGEAKYQAELMANGPFEVSFTVYADFEAYTGGIYQHKTGSELGGHAVKVIGWGVENNVKYWTIANSWNESWGEKGFFRIIRGTDECGIESSGAAGAAPSKLFLQA